MPFITGFGSEWDAKRRQSKFWVELDNGAAHAGFGERLPEARQNLQTQLSELGLSLAELGPYGHDLAAEIKAWEKQMERCPGGRAAEPSYDYSRAMRHGAKLTVDFIEGPSLGTIAVEQIGTVVFTKGSVRAGDPFQARSAAFARKVKPGSYPAFVSWAELPDEPRRRSVLAWIQFSQSPVTHWEQALTADQSPAELAPGEMFGVSVDSGCSCWADADIEVAQLDDEEPFEESAQGGNHLVAFTTGWGDGQYPCFWGLDGWRVRSRAGDGCGIDLRC